MTTAAAKRVSPDLENSVRSRASSLLGLAPHLIEQDLVDFVLAEGDALLRARAGSGKTTALAIKVAWLTRDRGVDPASIMLLVFNNAAARSIEGRLAAFGVDPAVRVRTFHAFGQRIVRAHFGASRTCVFDEKGEAGVLLADLMDDAVGEVLNERFYISCAAKMRTHYGKRREYVESVARDALTSSVAFLRARGFGTQDRFENAWTEGGPIAGNAMKVILGFERRMREEKLLDATGVLQAASWTLDREIDNGVPKNSDAHGVLWLFVDEFQDVSKPYMRLVENIRCVNGAVHVQGVGDDWQAINGFAGADLDYYEDPASHLDSPRMLDLLRNRRSGSAIVAWGNAVMAGAGDRGKPAISDPSNGAGEVRRARISATRDLTYFVSRLAERVDPGAESVALIARRWKVGDHGLSRVASLLTSALKGSKSRISITGITAHGSKGLEYDQVLLLDDGSFPLQHPSRPIMELLIPEEAYLREEACLKYVAGTRARNILDVIEAA